MLECCQGSCPTGKLCKDCPRAKPKPLDDMSPEAIGRRLRESNLRGDEPFPGYSGGKKIEQPVPPPPTDDDEPDYANITFVQIDAAAMDSDAMREFEKKIRDAMTIPPRFLEPSHGRRFFPINLSPGGTEYDSLHVWDETDPDRLR